MTLQQALDTLREGEAVIVDGRTFSPELIEEIQMPSGEMMYWIHDDGDLWLSIDPSSEEIIRFMQLEEGLEVDGDIVVYNGSDYELTLEGEGKMMEEGDEVEQIVYRDFERDNGDVVRIVEYAMSNEETTSVGVKLSEDYLQEA